MDRIKKLMTAAFAIASFMSFAGPRVTVIGDSYSTYVGTMPAGYATAYNGSTYGVTDVEQTYWMKIIRALNGVLEVNNSWSGAWVCNDNNSPTPSFISEQRLAQLGDPDLFIVCGGSNDCWWGDKYGVEMQANPLGDYVYANWTSSQLRQFRPAFAYLLGHLKTNYPKAEILVVINSVGGIYYPGYNVNDGITEEYARSMVEIAKHYDAMWVQCKDIEKTDLHPTPGGFAAMAEQALAVYNETHPNGWVGYSDEYLSADVRVATPADGVYVIDRALSGKIVFKDDVTIMKAVLVGGGGAGGGTLGGGGAGGGVVIVEEGLAADAGDELSFSIGEGGQSTGMISYDGTFPDGTVSRGANGKKTTMTLGEWMFEALGGGGGGGWVNNKMGANGANGGGGCCNNAGGTGLAGYNGGASTGSNDSDLGGGGGGGAAGAGENGTGAKGGNGGAGVVLDITGEQLDYGSGGGGGIGNGVTQIGLAGGAGAGDGGDHGQLGKDALDGRGGGGGGGGFRLEYPYIPCAGGSGGDGCLILVIELQNQSAPKISPLTIKAYDGDSVTVAFTVTDFGEGAETIAGTIVCSNLTTAAVIEKRITDGIVAGVPFEATVDGLDELSEYTVWATFANDLAEEKTAKEVGFKTTVVMPDTYMKSVISFPYAPETAVRDMPVLVRIAEGSPTGFSYDGIDTAKIRFSDADGAELAFDVDTWDAEGTSLIWVLVPSLSRTTRINFEWYPDSRRPALELGAADVWRGYQSVWHLNEKGGNGTYADASGNGREAVAQASRTADYTGETEGVEGYLGGGRAICTTEIEPWQGGGIPSYNQDGAYLTSENLYDNDAAVITLSFWAKHSPFNTFFDYMYELTSKDGTKIGCAQGGYTANQNDCNHHFGNGTSGGGSADQTATLAIGLNEGKWVHYAFTWRKADNIVGMFENGVCIAGNNHNPSLTDLFADEFKLCIGGGAKSGSLSWCGAMDEVRVVNRDMTDLLKLEHDIASVADFATLEHAERVLDPEAYPVLTGGAVGNVRLKDAKATVCVESIGAGAASAELYAVLIDCVRQQRTEVKLAEGALSGVYNVAFNTLLQGYDYTVSFYAVNDLGAVTRFPADDVLAFRTRAYESHRVMMTFPSAPVKPVADIPVPIRLAENSPEGFHYADVGKLVFFDEDGRELAADIDTWNTDGESIVWVVVPELSKETEVVMTWFATDEYKSKVLSGDGWESAGYQSVWHLAEAGSDATVIGTDSSNNDYNLKMIDTTVSTGLFGAGRRICDCDYTGNSGSAVLLAEDYADTGMLPTPFTISFWVRHRKSTSAYFDSLVVKRTKPNNVWTSGGLYAQLWYNGADQVVNIKCDGGFEQAPQVYKSFGAGDWMYFNVVVTDRTHAYFYCDGNVFASYEGNFNYNENNDALAFGGIPSQNEMLFNGSFDEIRVATTSRSAEQIKAEYEAMAKTNYISFGAVTAIEGTYRPGFVIQIR